MIKQLVVFNHKNHKLKATYVFDYLECFNGYFYIYFGCKRQHKIKQPLDFCILTNKDYHK